ncbi:MAG: HlyD family efflux transporter periplasmic adaptor subunit [Blastocatellia bacterium]|nr:HlyD family efflux transporter periplasmic adaptor subunit [Blastocatellia bacterium]
MNRRVAGLMLAILAIAGGAVYLRGRKGAGAAEGAASAKPSPTVASVKGIAAPGRVEPISEEIRLNAEISGRLKAVLVEEGDRVARGQSIAVLEDADYRARVASAEAQLAQKEAELRRIVNGSREQERREARAAIREAEATMANAQSEMERRRSLHATGDIAREEVERAERQFQVARARAEAARERHSFVDAAAREEDVDRAQAEISLARARVDEARAMLAKTIVRAPLAGRILRKHLKTGESVFGAANGQSQPIVTLADDSALRVRVDVDETDVARLQVGQRAYVTADAYPGKKFWGRVARIGEVLGKKNLRTDEPTEKVDTKVLETLIDLDPGSELRLGLRVDAFIGLD